MTKALIASSVVLIKRVEICTKAKNSAEARANSAAICHTPQPGRTMTSAPVKPTMTASQRRALTGSPSTTTDSAATINGAVKMGALASATGSQMRAMLNRSVLQMPKADRAM